MRNLPELTEFVWRKSSRSQGSGQCVELAYGGERAAVRDSKNTAGPVLRVGPAGLFALLGHVKRR